MKKIIMLSLTLVVCIMGTTASSETLTLATGEFCPYACDPAKEQGRVGFTTEILKKIFEKHGYTIEIKLLPWERAFYVFNNQQDGTDGIIGATREHPLRGDLALYPDIEISQYTHAFYGVDTSPLAGSWKYDGVDSLKGLRLGAVKGYSYCSAAMTKYVAETPAPDVDALLGVDLIKRNFLKVLNKRTDLWLANIPMAEYFFLRERENGNTRVDKIVRIDTLPCDGVVDAYPVFYKTDAGEKYASMFTEGMEALRVSGELAAILASYNLQDWR